MIYILRDYIKKNVPYQNTVPLVHLLVCASTCGFQKMAALEHLSEPCVHNLVNVLGCFHTCRSIDLFRNRD